MLRQLILSMWVVSLLSSVVFADDPQQTVGNQNLDEPSQNPPTNLEALIAKVRPSIATIKVHGRDGDQIGMGTGFVIDSEGLIATNLHVISEGRPFTVEMSSGRKLPVLMIEASDRTIDLALVRVDVQGKPLVALPLAGGQSPAQGTRVIAFGNPLGLRNSVVAGIVSAIRKVEGRDMIQLAIPVQPGNSGGPLVDSSGTVRGIINMKSAIDDNLGFAIPIIDLAPLREKPNPVTINRWVRLGQINEKKWTPLLGSTWQDRGGIVTARGLGVGFGGRSLCLATKPLTEPPLEISVQVRLDDEAGAAGLVFHCDGEHRHYGFYPTNGRLRLTCFKGPTVYSWQILEDLETQHYLPNQWNRLRVRMEPDRFKCFVNGHLVIESTDKQLTAGRCGLVKFRDTNPDFKGFEFGATLPSQSMSEEAGHLLAEVFDQSVKLGMIDSGQVAVLGESPEAVSRALTQHAMELDQQAKRLRRLASDVELAPTLRQLQELMSDASASETQLLRGALLIASLDNPDMDVDAYQQRIDEMATEIRDDLPEHADAIARRDALHKYLFDENGFHGERAEYYHPANSHLNRVIDDREGLPITLSILYMELGKRLDLRIEGVGLPGHFVVKHVFDDTEQLIDVFDRGKLLSRDDADRIVIAYGRRAMTEHDLRAQTVVEILSRVLNNLMGVARGKQDIESMLRYCEALLTVNPESVELRMMRSQIRAMTDRGAGAVEDLDWLIENDPPGLDRTRVRQLRDAIVNSRRDQGE